MAVLRALNLSKSYKKRPVIRDVSLSVESGAIVGLLGPNGAGKTTCFYMIVGLNRRQILLLNVRYISLRANHRSMNLIDHAP